MRVVLCTLVGLVAACRTSGSTQVTAKHPPVELPVVVEEDRFFLQARTAGGGDLRVFLDSAGEMSLTRAAVERLRLPVRRDQTREGELATAPFPTFYDGRLPRPMVEAVPVVDEAPIERADGTLGALWFAGRVFTFDYAGKQVWLRSAGDLPAVPAAHRIPVGIPQGEPDAPGASYPRIQVEIDGVALDMLLDIGATVTLTDAARQALGGAARERATSFVIEAMFERWRSAHPEWRVIEGADRAQGGAPMIEVPAVRIANHGVGPVWFTRRPDRSAIGGSALRHFQRVTVDWANATAVFER
jgi:hypothetical protein